MLRGWRWVVIMVNIYKWRRILKSPQPTNFGHDNQVSSVLWVRCPCSGSDKGLRDVLSLWDVIRGSLVMLGCHIVPVLQHGESLGLKGRKWVWESNRICDTLLYLILLLFYSGRKGSTFHSPKEKLKKTLSFPTNPQCHQWYWIGQQKSGRWTWTRAEVMTAN